MFDGTHSTQLMHHAPPRTQQPVVALDGVSRIFAGGVGLSSVDLAVSSGEVVGVTGTSGCGKSTLLRLIAGLETASSGTIERNYNRLGMVFQEPTLLPWLTAQGNVELVLKPIRATARAGGAASRGT